MVGLTEDEQLATESDPEHAKLWSAITENVVSTGSGLLKLRDRVEDLEFRLLLRQDRQFMVLVVTASTLAGLVIERLIAGIWGGG